MEWREEFQTFDDPVQAAIVLLFASALFLRETFGEDDPDEPWREYDETISRLEEMFGFESIAAVPDGV